MIITSNTIFYFSGTGNSLHVAKDLKESLDKTCVLQPISEIIDQHEVEINSEWIGIVFPVYMLGIPLLVADFIKKMKFKGQPYLFAIATCSGNVGRSFKQINELLNQNSQRLNAECTVKMPGNNILRYHAKSRDRQLKLFQQEKKDIIQIAEIISLHHNTLSTPTQPLMNIIAPMAYKKLENQYGSVPKFYSTEACNGCGLCQRVCCVKNIKIEEKQPVWQNYCQQCMACIQHCPKEAIQYGFKTVGRTRYKNPNVNILSQR